VSRGTTARKRLLTSKWHVNETYIKEKGEWTYLYRAIDKSGDRQTGSYRGFPVLANAISGRCKGVFSPGLSAPRLAGAGYDRRQPK
jgi:hypothetical protein